MHALLLALALMAAPPEPPPEATRSIRHLLVVWRDAWERQDLRLYMACYADDYRSGNRDKEGLRQHKQQVFAKTSWAEVALEDVRLEQLADDRVAVRFLQTYASNRLEDRGEKTLILARRGERWLIVDEQFRELRR